MKTFLMIQPDEWLAAFREQATRNGENLSQFLGDCAMANLDRDLRKGLPKRPQQGGSRKKGSAK